MNVWDWIYSVIETPMFRAVPSITFMADSILEQFKSGSFVLAISSNWDLLIFPTDPLADSPAPFSIPAALVIKTEAGGVLVIKVKLLSSKLKFQQV